MLSPVFSCAAASGEIAENPIEGFERLHRDDRADIVCSEQDIRRFMESALVESQPALILPLYTGQRYGDLIRLRRADYDGRASSLRQSKTGAPVVVPCMTLLKAMLDGMRRRGLFILTWPDGGLGSATSCATAS